MIFKTRKIVKPGDLNPRGTLFGGQLLKWLDEEAAVFVICQLETDKIVTKLVSEINFVAPGNLGDVIEFGIEAVHLGKTSITIRCVVQNKNTKSEILTVDKMVFVCVDKDGKPFPHGITEIKES